MTRERPILFSAPNVRAILAGTKTQTRRELRGFFPPNRPEYDSESGRLEWFNGDEVFIGMRCPYGQPGDRLWVREAFRLVAEADAIKPRNTDAAFRVWHEADAPHQPGAGKLRPGIFMPRWASRITLEVTGVRVERLHGISAKDIIAEGAVERPHVDQFGRNPVSAFDGKVYMDLQSLWALGWEAINGHGSWNANPWVWVVEFKRISP
jgi:hypothetical protein